MGYNDGDSFLTVQEVAEFLKLSVLTIYKYIRLGKLDSMEFGGHYRISRSSLENFIKNHRVSNHHSKKNEK